MDHLWQSPFVNLFKYYNLAQWKKANKEGDVASAMDKTVKGTIYKIAGSIPAGNFINLPKTTGQSLGLTGRFLYILFKPTPSKHFVVHMDLVTSDSLVIRVSFSNLFKEFKSTSTWLQFPFVCARQGSLPSFIAEAAKDKDQSGPAPMLTRWSVICLDLQHILSMYLNRKFLYLKSIKLCANMSVKNVFTSSNLYDPDLTMTEAKRKGLMAQGLCPLPRDMSFPLGKGENWHDSYDWIRFPQDNAKKVFDSIQAPNPFSPHKAGASKPPGLVPRRIQPKTVDVSKCVSDRVAMIHKLTAPPKQPTNQLITKEVPAVTDLSENYDDVHVYAHPSHEEITTESKRMLPRTKTKMHKEGPSHTQTTNDYTTLDPDPIMKLKRIIGFGGASYRDVLWSSDGSSIIYPCHAVIVAMKITSGQQRFFIGHTDKVSCLTMSGNSSLLASGQTGQMATVRVWKYSTGECLAIGKAHVHSLTCLSFSSKGSLLCGVGKDSHGKNFVVAWNTSKVSKQREMPVLAKAHTDVDIQRLVVAPFDETKLVSCGTDNLRLWRIKDGSLRSAPVGLGEYNSMEFTDVCFESCSHFDVEPENKMFYACSKSGHIFEVDYNSLTVHHVRRLLPTKTKVTRTGQQTDSDNAAKSLCINSIHLNDTFCVTGSEDGYLRLWPLDFAHVYLEAEHEGPVTVAKLSSDGLKIIAGTSTDYTMFNPQGNLGMLDVSSRDYTTLMRSHTNRIHSFALDVRRSQLATVSEDQTIRVWDTNTLQQLYDFSAPDELPCTINYHPTKQVFACGFHSGAVRIFNVESTSLMAEHKELRGQVTGLVYTPDGSRLFACCSMGVAAAFDSSLPTHPSIRVVAGLVARGDKYGPQAIAVSPCGRRTAFVGPSELTVTVADAKCLDELLRIDISKMSVASTPSSPDDSAVRLAFSASQIGHLIVTTADNRLAKYDCRNGRLLFEMEHVHRKGCSTIAVSGCGHYMATGGDKTVKVWDYAMGLDINFQVFIGHSENVSRILFHPDGLGLLSAGEAVYMWDFLAHQPPTPLLVGRMDLQDLESLNLEDLDGEGNNKISPRSDDIDGLSSIHTGSDLEDLSESVRDKFNALPKPPATNGHIEAKPSSSLPSKHFPSNNDVVKKPITALSNNEENNHPTFPRSIESKMSILKDSTQARDASKKDSNLTGGGDGPPNVFSCYMQREKTHGIAQRRYTAPPNQAGLKLKSVIGYNCNGRGNMVWHPDTGLFAYSTGCIIVVEDLTNGQQKYLQGHTEEISTLALQHDGLVLVSASCACHLSPCQVCVWDMQTQTCKKVLVRHKFGVQCMQFSRDDRFLITVGDYRENELVVWSTSSYQVVASSYTACSMFDLKWDPFTVNEFVSVGDGGTVLFWLLDDTSPNEVSLNVHQAGLPKELETKHGQSPVSFTCVAYGGNKTMFIGTQTGNVSAWDTRNNSCFLHWEAHNGEITCLVARQSRLMSASKTGSLKMWSVGRIVGGGGGGSKASHKMDLTMEDEMKVDGAVTAISFDDTLDMGIVGTSSGTLWYINWTERSSIRLVSGHQNKINSVSFLSGHLVTGGDDGSVRVWSLSNREQVLQFQVMEQSCTSLAAILTSGKGGNSDNQSSHQWVVGGYSDGTVRLFDIGSVSMILKLQPHPVTVTAVAISHDGEMILSGASDGQIALSSPASGMTIRVFSDHKGVAISNFDVTLATDEIDVGVTAPVLWLASSLDRRVSVWSADWSTGFCDLVDWLSFPAPALMPDGSRIKKNDMAHFHQLPPSLARFSPSEADVIVYTGYGMEKAIQFYSLTQRKVVRTVNLTHWCLSLDVSPDSSFIAVGIPERLIKLVDYAEGSFQDYTSHSDVVSTVKFSPTGNSLFTISHNEILVWEAMV